MPKIVIFIDSIRACYNKIIKKAGAGTLQLPITAYMTVFYVICQKQILNGVVNGAVK